MKENFFIKALINNNVIYIKVHNVIINELFDILHDNEYIITKSNYDEWGDNIEYGTSYELISFEEFYEFKEYNLRIKELTNET